MRVYIYVLMHMCYVPCECLHTGYFTNVSCSFWACTLIKMLFSLWDFKHLIRHHVFFLSI